MEKDISLWQPASSPPAPNNSFWTFSKENPSPPKISNPPQPRLSSSSPPAPVHKLFEFKPREEQKVLIKEETDWDELRQFKGEGILPEELSQDIPEKKLMQKPQEPIKKTEEHLTLHQSRERKASTIYVPTPTPIKKALIIRKTITRPKAIRRRVNSVYRTRNRREIERLLRNYELNEIMYRK